ncbi:RimK family alpha-L-glutamate ligase [Legionella sp. km772]|uniref:ATP-grasp domain-containing protein n=1 Tax=Legionella sp. km772 TaxID=2498111 RepID=UPI000F8F5B64|nr:hypothetical protein [Legionella sp. km772]RUR12491.1 hypothetical protein ELY15_04925 [Legionella sp. km772]
MSKKNFDVLLLTQNEYVSPKLLTPYVENVLLEDNLLKEALEAKGLTVTRGSWDEPDFDWASTSFVLFRAIWDYFHRFKEFDCWLSKAARQTQFINSYSIIRWNMDKHYLLHLQSKKINIPPTLFLEKGETVLLKDLFYDSAWDKAILKPAIAGGARHTYLLDKSNVEHYQDIFQQLIAEEALLFQEFQRQIISRGEVSFMIFGGKYSHAVLKKAKQGDFRVQDDFGGSVDNYYPTRDEIEFAEHVVNCCKPFLPIYARVDVMWDNQNRLCVSELELIEPELWLRSTEKAASHLADALVEYMNGF